MYVLHQILAQYPYLALLQAAFTVWMLVDCSRRSVEPYWFWMILFFQPLGAFLYLFAVKLRDFQGWPGLSFSRAPSLDELRYRVEQSPTLANRVQLAQRLIARKEYEEAVPYLEGARKIEPDLGLVLYSLAFCQVQRGKPELAGPLLDHLTTREPAWNRYAGLRLLIEARKAAGEEAGAQEACRKLLRLDPTLENHCLLAEHLLEADRAAEAGELLDRCLREHAYRPLGLRLRDWRWARKARRLREEARA